MLKAIPCAIMLFTATLSSPAWADSAERSLLEQFTGTWTSNGAAFGVSANSRMNWREVLGGKFIRLDYHIEMRRSGAVSVFEGAAYYQKAQGGDYRAFWADSSGDLHPIQASRDGSALVAHWGVPGGKQGRTRYELLDSGDMEVTDWLKTPQGWRRFNQNVFQRTAADSEQP